MFISGLAFQSKSMDHKSWNTPFCTPKGCTRLQDFERILPHAIMRDSLPIQLI